MTTRRRRRAGRAAASAVLAFLALAGVSCVPPTTPSVPPPVLPPGVGVRWTRDAGGTWDAGQGTYTPDWQSWVTTAAATTGPSPGTALFPPNPYYVLPELPDGTARFPWNGFAGEGITVATVDDVDRVVFPGGSCGVGYLGLELSDPAIVPSPDGTKVAVLRRDISGYIPRYTVAIVAMVDGSECPAISSASYGGGVGEPPPGTVYEGVFSHLVWSADSSAVAYPVSHQPDNLRALDRLDATPGATPQRVLPPSGTNAVPYGWSVGGRLLVGEVTQTPEALVSKLLTMNPSGGALRTIDTAYFRTSLPALLPWPHYGYFVPGTTTIVYADGSTTVTDAGGWKLPWFRLRVVADAAGAVSGPLTGVEPTLVWHHDGLPPNDLDVPNLDMIDRFVH